MGCHEVPWGTIYEVGTKVLRICYEDATKLYQVGPELLPSCYGVATKLYQVLHSCYGDNEDSKSMGQTTASHSFHITWCCTS